MRRWTDPATREANEQLHRREKVDAALVDVTARSVWDAREEEIHVVVNDSLCESTRRRRRCQADLFRAFADDN
jgi:hypothetical protein